MISRVLEEQQQNSKSYVTLVERNKRKETTTEESSVITWSDGLNCNDSSETEEVGFGSFLII